MDDYSISLGNAVKEAHTESKLTQEQIADMLDIDSLHNQPNRTRIG